MKLSGDAQDKSIFPLAVPSIASPGAMLAAVMQTENTLFSLPEQAQITVDNAVGTGVGIGLDARLYLCASYYRRQWREHYKPHHGHYSRVDGGNQRIRGSRCLLRAMTAGSGQPSARDRLTATRARASIAKLPSASEAQSAINSPSRRPCSVSSPSLPAQAPRLGTQTTRASQRAVAGATDPTAGLQSKALAQPARGNPPRSVA